MRISTCLFGKTKCAVRLMIVAISAALALLAAEAQETSSSEPSFFDLSLEELMQVSVKSTSFFERDQLTAGSSVSVIERADWERKGVRRTLDAIAQEPSVMLLPSLYGQNVIAIRGYAGLSSARGIATLVDGIPMNGPFLGSGQYLAQNINLGVLDRIELIRGPGSALYGTDAFHGVLSMSTFESEEDLTRASVEGGSDHYYQASLQQSVGLGDFGRLDFALGVSGEEFERTYYALDLNTLAGREIDSTERYRSQTGSLKLTLNPTPQLKIKGGLLVDNYEADNYPANFYTVSESDLNSRTLAGQLSATYSFAHDQTLEARIHHMRNQSPASRIGVFAGFGLAELDTNQKEERTGTTLTFRQPETEQWRTEYAVSLGFERLLLKDGWTNYSPLDPPSSPTRTDVGAKGEHRDITHLVLDARTVLPGDHWSVLYGGRVDHYSDMDTQMSPRLGLVFQPVEDTAIKLLYHRAFRAPTFAERYSIPPTIVVFDLDPEILNSYELVVLKQCANWKGEVVLFQNDWDDGIRFSLDPSSPVGYVYENSGKNQARGVEASLGWHSDAWRVDLGGSYVRSSNLNTDEDYQLFPPIMINAGVGRTFEGLGLDIYLNNHFFDGAQDITPDTILGTPQDLPVYWRTDLNVTKTFSSGLDVFVSILNLFDRDNRVPSVLGFPGGVEDRSLSVSIGMRYAF